MDKLYWDKEDSKSIMNLIEMMDGLTLKTEDGKASLKEIPVPRVTYYKKLQYKGSARHHKALTKLLYLKSTTSKKTFPKSRGQNAITTFQEKLSDLYRKHHRKNTLIKEMNFLKKDFLQELVLTEELNYLILEILPQNKYYYLIEELRVPATIEGTLYEDIESETLSIALFKEIFQVMELYSKDIRAFMHNYHIILNLRKYFSQAEYAQPVFSTFILLKPTNMLLIKLTELSEDYEFNDDQLPHLDNLKKESEVFFELSGPLYLGTKPLAKEFVNFLKEYRYEFDTEIFGQEPVEEGKNLRFEINLPPLFEYINGISSRTRKYFKLLKTPLGLPLKISRDVVFSEMLWSKYFCLFLKERRLRRPYRNHWNHYELDEIYFVKFSMNANGKTMPFQCFISIFHHNDGTFQFCTTIRLFEKFLPRYPDALFIKIEDRQLLDKFIAGVISYLHQISVCGLDVNCSSLREKFEFSLYTGDENLIKELNKGSRSSRCCVQDALFSSRRKNYLDSFGYTECIPPTTFERQQVLVDGVRKNAIVEVEKPPFVVFVCYFLEDQIYFGREPEELEIRAASLVQSGNLMTAFEAHKSEIPQSYPYKTHGENGEELRYEYYSCVYHPYECYEEDFLDGYDLIITDDIRRFLKVCRKGGAMPDKI